MDPCVGVSVQSARGRCSIQLCLSAPTRGVHALRCDAAILRFQCAGPMSVGSALGCYITTYVAGVKSEPGIAGICGLGPRMALPETPFLELGQ